MKKNQFVRCSQWILLVVCILLLTAGCNGSGEAWDAGLLSKDNEERPRTSAEVLMLFSNLSTRFDNLLEYLDGTAEDEKMQQLMQRLPEATLINLTTGDLLGIQYNQQQIEMLTETATARAAELKSLLQKQNDKGAPLSAKQIILLDRLLEEYAKDLEELLLDAEMSKANQMDNLDLETLKGFSAAKFIDMQGLEIEALSTLNDYLKEVNRILNE
ncbi:MAG: hypothetical protein HY818_11390 [Acetobacterium woodii]|nr:hypothetical protein [Acetobacterium woodii]